jgi:hypothetical protein
MLKENTDFFFYLSITYEKEDIEIIFALLYQRALTK